MSTNCTENLAILRKMFIFEDLTSEMVEYFYIKCISSTLENLSIDFLRILTEQNFNFLLIFLDRKAQHVAANIPPVRGLKNEKTY